MRGSVTVVGEALVDVVHGADGSVTRHAGGSPANVAVGLARLGVPVELITRFGADSDGDLLAAHFTANSVDVRGGGDSLPTGVATAHLDATGAADYHFQIRWQLVDRDPPNDSSWVHTGSLAAVLEPGASDVAALFSNSRRRSLTSYDPNCRPALMRRPDRARALIERFVGLADLVKASHEDLEWLYPGRLTEMVARRWLGLGASIVIITLAERGAMAFSSAGSSEWPAASIPVVDTVGAGDSFTAAALQHLLGQGYAGPSDRTTLGSIDSDGLAALLASGLSAAAITCSRPGAQPPTLAELPASPSG